MGAGSSLSIYYKLPGPLPAGSYAVQIDGYSSANDAHIRADLVLRPAGAVDGGGDVIVASIDGPPPPASDGFKSRNWIKTKACSGPLGGAGDGLVLIVNYLSGSAIFGSIVTSLTVP